MTGDVAVPTGLLTVLDGEELSCSRSAQQVTVTRDVHSLEAVLTFLVDGLGIGPTQGITLIQGVTGGAAAIVVVTATSHHVPTTGMMALATTFSVVGVIEVGQAQHMAELVGHCADTLDNYCAGAAFPTIEFGRAGIAVNPLAVKREIGIVHVGGMRPQIA